MDTESCGGGGGRRGSSLSRSSSGSIVAVLSVYFLCPKNHSLAGVYGSVIKLDLQRSQKKQWEVGNRFISRKAIWLLPCDCHAVIYLSVQLQHFHVLSVRSCASCQFDGWCFTLYRHGVYELLHCLGKNIPAINAVECVFASQVPSIAAVPAPSKGQRDITD